MFLRKFVSAPLCRQAVAFTRNFAFEARPVPRGSRMVQASSHQPIKEDVVREFCEKQGAVRGLWAFNSDIGQAAIRFHDPHTARSLKESGQETIPDLPPQWSLYYKDDVLFVSNVDTRNGRAELLKLFEEFGISELEEPTGHTAVIAYTKPEDAERLLETGSMDVDGLDVMFKPINGVRIRAVDASVSLTIPEDLRWEKEMVRAAIEELPGNPRVVSTFQPENRNKLFVQLYSYEEQEQVIAAGSIRLGDVELQLERSKTAPEVKHDSIEKAARTVRILLSDEVDEDYVREALENKFGPLVVCKYLRNTMTVIVQFETMEGREALRNEYPVGAELSGLNIPGRVSVFHANAGTRRHNSRRGGSQRRRMEDQGEETVDQYPNEFQQQELAEDKFRHEP